MNDSTGPGVGGEASTVEPAPFDDTLRFLRLMRHDGRCVLSAICPNGGGIETRTFDIAQPDRLRAWLGKWNGKRNLYWTPNTVRANADPNWKPSETDIEWFDMVHVDVDPDPAADWAEDRQRILSRLEAFDLPPSAIVDSGNGYQAFWLLVPKDRIFIGGHPVAIAEAKLYNIELRNRLGGDSCQSLDHLMRLPGTKNLPNEKKRKAGRVERIASVVKWPKQ